MKEIKVWITEKKQTAFLVKAENEQKARKYINSNVPDYDEIEEGHGESEGVISVKIIEKCIKTKIHIYKAKRIKA